MPQINREDKDLQIRVAAGHPLSIKSHTARNSSSVAEGQPSGAEVWDVSGLRNSLDRSTFSRETVSTWVNCVYAATYGPRELAPEDLQLLSSATGLQQVLAFAHAVGSNLGLLCVACSQLASLRFAVKLPEQTLEVPIIAKRPFFALLELEDKLLAGTGSLGSVSSAQQQGEVRRCIASQVAALLHIAHVLRCSRCCMSCMTGCMVRLCLKGAASCMAC